MVTARGDDANKIVGLELGADDYLAKPFNPRELLARIRAVLRRTEPGEAPRFQSGGLVIDFAAREVTVDGKRQTLTAHEYELLCALARNSGRVLTRDQLAGGDEGRSRRRGLRPQHRRPRLAPAPEYEPDPRHPRYVKTVRGAGYLLARES